MKKNQWVALNFYLRKEVESIKSLRIIALSDLISHFYAFKCWFMNPP